MAIMRNCSNNRACRATKWINTIAICMVIIKWCIRTICPCHRWMPHRTIRHSRPTRTVLSYSIACRAIMAIWQHTIHCQVPINVLVHRHPHARWPAIISTYKLEPTYRIRCRIHRRPHQHRRPRPHCNNKWMLPVRVAHAIAARLLPLRAMCPAYRNYNSWPMVWKWVSRVTHRPADRWILHHRRIIIRTIQWHRRPRWSIKIAIWPRLRHKWHRCLITSTTRMYRRQLPSIRIRADRRVILHQHRPHNIWAVDHHPAVSVRM